MDTLDDRATSSLRTAVPREGRGTGHWKLAALLMSVLLVLELLVRGSAVQLHSTTDHGDVTASASFLMLELGDFRAQIIWNFAN